MSNPQIKKVVAEIFDQPVEILMDESNLDLISAVLDYTEANERDFRNHLVREGRFETAMLSRDKLSAYATVFRDYLDKVQNLNEART